MATPFPTQAFNSADGRFSFIVLDLTSTADPQLEATNAYGDDDPDNAPLQVASKGVTLTGTVSLSGPAGSRKWRVGWIQTIYPCRQAVTYERPADNYRGKLVCTIDRSRRDGDLADDGGHCIWYATSDSSKEIAPSSPVIVEMDDQPNVSFHDVYNGKAADWIKGWKGIAVEGTKSFCSWLIAEAADDHEIVYLYHVVWECDYTTSLKDGRLVAPSGGTRIISHGPGQGSKTPNLEKDPIDEEDFPPKPDAALNAAKPAFTRAAPSSAVRNTPTLGARKQNPDG
ncbi:hypothetical protein [Planobispora takensis]|uniref:Uncharacterized protein n=1 Tax=Planobispora takensis TaxID=1367882 RepID=A0A8J3WUX3_9ACTN|nr:hypothetical protein [Planobispora takensis]GII00337.1 hypothetical protein Pta02_23450 [Planobispora takensis]